MITFDLTTPAGRRACVLWHVGRGLMVKEAERLAGMRPGTATTQRRHHPEYAVALDAAKRHGRAIARQAGKPIFARDMRHDFLARVRAGEAPAQVLRSMGLIFQHVANWRRYIRGFQAEYDAAKAEGAPRRCDPRARQIARLLASGEPLKRAAAAVGMYSTALVYRWRDTGRPEWHRVIAPHYRPWLGGKRPRPLDVAA